MGTVLRTVVLALLGALLIGPAWLLATESGLQAAAAIAGRVTAGALRIEAVRGRLAGTFTVEGVAYEHPATTVSIGRATLNLHLSRLLLGRIQAETLDVQTLVVAVHDGPATPADAAQEPLTVRTPVWLMVEQGVVRDFRLQLGDAAAPWVVPEAAFSARWRDVHFRIARLAATTQEVGPVRAKGRFTIEDDRLHFSDLEVHGPGSALVNGALALTDTAHSDLAATWTDLRPPDDTSGMEWRSARGRAELKGPWSGYGWTTEAAVAGAGFNGDVTAHGRGNLDGLDVQGAELRTLKGTVRSRGRLGWRGGFWVDGHGEFVSLDPAARFAGWPGRLNGQARFRGEWRQATPQLDFEAALRDSELRGYPLNLRTVGSTEGGRVVLREFRLDSGASTLAAQGRLLPDFDLRGTLHSNDLRALWGELAGGADLRARLHGTPQAPALEVAGSAQQLEYRGWTAAGVAVDATLAPAAHSDVRLELHDVEAGVVLRRVALQAAGTRAAHRLRVHANGADNSGGFVLEGRERAGRWDGRLVEARAAPSGDDTWLLEEPAALRWDGRRLRVEPVCLGGGASRACAQFDGGAQRQWLAFRLRQFELRKLRRWLPEDWTLGGHVTGTAALTVVSGELAGFTADLAASAGSVEAGGTRLAFGPSALRVRPDGDRLRAELHLTPGGGQIRGELELAAGASLLDRSLQGTLIAQLPDLAWLPVLSPEITTAQGALSADLRVLGTLRQPALEGRVDISNGRVRLTTPGIELTEFSANFESSAQAPLTLRLQATSGKGRMDLQGQLTTLRPRPAGRVTLKGENVLWVNTPEMRAWVSPDLELTFSGRQARLTGEIQVPRAQITPHELASGGVAPSADEVIVSEAGDAGEEALQLDSEVRITLGENVSFDGLGLKTRLAGGIVAFDEPGRPTRARGELRLVGGRYRAYGQDLQIETGRLLFTGGNITDPGIDLSAFRRPSETVKVGLRARGRLDAPTFSVYSEPAMSQEETLSWLVLGRSLSETLAAGQRSEITGAAASLGLTGGDLLAQQIAPRLGFDEVSVGARPGETAEMARVTIGKYLSPKLFVSYGVGLFQPGNYFRLQYDLGKGFKLAGESGVQQGGDLLYTIER